MFLARPSIAHADARSGFRHSPVLRTFHVGLKQWLNPSRRLRLSIQSRAPQDSRARGEHVRSMTHSMPCASDYISRNSFVKSFQSGFILLIKLTFHAFVFPLIIR